MPYKNPMNEAVARKVNHINRSYIAHTDMNGMTNAINWVNPAVESPYPTILGAGHGDRVVGGGVGCADFQRSSATKHYEGDADKEKTGGAILGLQDGTLAGDRSKPIQRVRKYKTGDSDNKQRFGALGTSLPSDIGISDQTIPAARYQQGYAQKDQSPLETQPESFARAVLPPAQGSGKKRGRKPRSCPCGSKTKKACKCMEGGNGFASGTHMDTGFGTTLGAKDNGGVKNTGNLDLKDTPRKKLKGKGNAQVGGAILGLVKPPVEGKLDSTVSEQKPAPGVTTKKTLKSTPKKELDKPVEKAQMPSSTVSGLGKPKNAKKEYESDDAAAPKKRVGSARTKERAAIVKKVMAEHGLSLPAASKYVKEHNLF